MKRRTVTQRLRARIAELEAKLREAEDTVEQARGEVRYAVEARAKAIGETARARNELERERRRRPGQLIASLDGLPSVDLGRIDAALNMGAELVVQRYTPAPPGFTASTDELVRRRLESDLPSFRVFALIREASQ